MPIFMLELYTCTTCDDFYSIRC